MPECGIEVIEFPCVCLAENRGEVISTTKVRKLVHSHDLEGLQEFRLESMTIDISKSFISNKRVGVAQRIWNANAHDLKAAHLYEF